MHVCESTHNYNIASHTVGVFKTNDELVACFIKSHAMLANVLFHSRTNVREEPSSSES